MLLPSIVVINNQSLVSHLIIKDNGVVLTFSFLIYIVTHFFPVLVKAFVFPCVKVFVCFIQVLSIVFLKGVSFNRYGVSYISGSFGLCTVLLLCLCTFVFL